MRQSATDAEAAMRRLLHGRNFVGLKFRRQYPFENYILDFVCLEKRVVVEIDGSQHSDSGHDVERDRAMKVAGFRTFRYWNNDVLLRPASVPEDLLSRLDGFSSNPSPRSGLRPERPSPARGEGKRGHGGI
jgi:very-short-patch-repair endonuclease